MVGRAVRAALRRLCRLVRRGHRIRRRRCGFRPGRRFHLGRSARCQGGAGRGRAGDPTGACRHACKSTVRKRNDRTGITPDMNFLRPISMLAGLAMAMAATAAFAQISLTPPAAQPPARAPPPRRKRLKPHRSQGDDRSQEAARNTEAAARRSDSDANCIADARVRRSQRRSRLRRLSARSLQDRVRSRDHARDLQQRPEGDDDAGRALRQRHGRQARLRQGRRMVSARVRGRRPRGHVRAGDDETVRPRRQGRPRAGGQASGLLGQARRAQGGL